MNSNGNSVKKFAQDVEAILGTPIAKKYPSLLLEEYPFDEQLLSLSAIYRKSRKLYVKIGGSYRPVICSTMRSLSTANLFGNQIEYSPTFSELLWLKDNYEEVYDPHEILNALSTFNGISVYHEQNHRTAWRLLPKAPQEERSFFRYLNFSESLIVTLDLALGDELGAKISHPLERMGVVYRPGGKDRWFLESKTAYRQYLLALFYVTYLILELVDRRDLAKCLKYVFPNQSQMNTDVLKRGLELSEMFTRNTNLEWQTRNWKQSQIRLAKVQKNSQAGELNLPKDPLDFASEFIVVENVLDVFGL